MKLQKRVGSEDSLSPTLSPTDPRQVFEDSMRIYTCKVVAFGGREGVAAVMHGRVDEVSCAVQPSMQAPLRVADQQLHLGACPQPDGARSAQEEETAQGTRAAIGQGGSVDGAWHTTCRNTTCRPRPTFLIFRGLEFRYEEDSGGRGARNSLQPSLSLVKSR